MFFFHLDHGIGETPFRHPGLIWQERQPKPQMNGAGGEKGSPFMIDIIGGQGAMPCYPQLGGGFKHFLFSPLFGEDFHFDYYFSKGLKPPTSPGLQVHLRLNLRKDFGCFDLPNIQQHICQISHDMTEVWRYLPQRIHKAQVLQNFFQ